MSQDRILQQTVVTVSKSSCQNNTSERHVLLPESVRLPATRCVILHVEQPLFIFLSSLTFSSPHRSKIGGNILTQVRVTNCRLAELQPLTRWMTRSSCQQGTGMGSQSCDWHMGSPMTSSAPRRERTQSTRLVAASPRSVFAPSLRSALSLWPVLQWRPS